MLYSSLLAVLGATAANAAPALGKSGPMEKLDKRSVTTSTKPTYNGCTYPVIGLGAFTEGIESDFTALTSLPSTLSPSTDLIGALTAPFDRQFASSNVGILNGQYITLTVPGGQTSNPISSAEIQTLAKDILYGSFRTVAKASSSAGVTQAFSFYANDTQEIDIAFLTDDPTQLHLTNEQTGYGQPSTSFSVAAPSDATTAFHEYRMDWTPSGTSFYVDSVLQYTITQNVPSTPGFYLWNTWSNGDAWAKGPPINDAVLEIQSVALYFNRTSVTPNMQSSACSNAYSSFVSASQACSALSLTNTTTGQTFNDTNGVVYNVLCGHDADGQGDIGAVAANSYEGCMAQCDATSPCNAVAYTGGSSAGTCYMKDLSKATISPNVASNVDLAYIYSSYLAVQPKTSTSSSTTKSTTTSTTASTTASTTPAITSSATTTTATRPTTFTGTSASCSALPTSYTDANNVNYTIDCSYDLQGIGDIGATSVSSFFNCLAQCDSFTGCQAIAYVGGTGPGTCYFKSLKGVTQYPNANSGVDLAYIASDYTGTMTSTTTTSAAKTTASPTTTQAPVVGSDGITTVAFPPTCTSVSTNTYAVVDDQGTPYLFMCGGGSGGSTYTTITGVSNWDACFDQCDGIQGCTGFSYNNGAVLGAGTGNCLIKTAATQSFTSTANMLSTRIAGLVRSAVATTTASAGH